MIFKPCATTCRVIRSFQTQIIPSIFLSDVELPLPSLAVQFKRAKVFVLHRTPSTQPCTFMVSPERRMVAL
jgi:hypothetical protein